MLWPLSVLVMVFCAEVVAELVDHGYPVVEGGVLALE
jgi:hypothetical protein